MCSDNEKTDKDRQAITEATKDTGQTLNTEHGQQHERIESVEKKEQRQIELEAQHKT